MDQFKSMGHTMKRMDEALRSKMNDMNTERMVAEEQMRTLADETIRTETMRMSQKLSDAATTTAALAALDAAVRDLHEGTLEEKRGREKAVHDLRLEMARSHAEVSPASILPKPDPPFPLSHKSAPSQPPSHPPLHPPSHPPLHPPSHPPSYPYPNVTRTVTPTSFRPPRISFSRYSRAVIWWPRRCAPA